MGSTVFSILRPETPPVVTVSPLGYPALHIYRIRPIHGTAPVSYRSSFDSVATSFSGFFLFSFSKPTPINHTLINVFIVQLRDSIAS